MKVNKFQRGQIWWFKTNQAYDGSVQGKTRPVIILSNNLANMNSNNLLAVPCTTQIKRLDMKTHIRFNIGTEDNIALCESLLNVNTQRLVEYIGTCDDELIEKLEYGMQIALGLVDVPSNDIPKVEVTKPMTVDEYVETITEATPEEDIADLSKGKVGRRPKYTEADMIRFVNDYETHDMDFMINKYGELNNKAVANKVYRFRKIINKGE